MSIPAENKWLALTPVARKVTLLQCVHGLLPYLEHYIHARNGGSQEQRKHVVLGADYAITQDWAVTRSTYNRRAAGFMHAYFTSVKLLFYLMVVEPLMTLHFKLFNHGTRNVPSGPMADIESKPGLCFDLAQPERSPVIPVFSRLSDLLVKSMFDIATSDMWRPVLHKLGHGDWTDYLWWAIRGVLLALLGGTRRKLLYIWDALPFGDLIKAFDPRNTDEVTERSFGVVNAVKKCCLDPGCTRQLRRRFRRFGRRRSPRLHRFMVSFYSSVQLCSSPLECNFAAYRQWLARSYRPLSVANLGSKDMVNKVSCDARDARDIQDTRRNPLWAMQRKKTNGLHLFMEEVTVEDGETWTDVLQRGKTSFGELSPGKKRTFGAKARAYNQHSKLLQSIELDGHIERIRATGSNTGSYLNLGDDKFPFGVHRLQHAGYGQPASCPQKRKSAEWELMGRRVRSSKEFGHGRAPSQHCPREICVSALSPERRARLAQIHWALEHATVAFAEQSQHGQPILRPKFASGPGAEIWQCTSMTKARPGHPFEAEYAKMDDLAIGTDGTGVSELCFVKETIAKSVVVKVVVSEVLEAQWFRNDAQDALLGFDHLVCERGPFNKNKLLKIQRA